jgi:hypothetical protein
MQHDDKTSAVVSILPDPRSDRLELAALDTGRETLPRLAAEDLSLAVAVRGVADRYAPAVGGDFHAVVAIAAVAALPPWRTGQVRVIRGGHRAPSFFGSSVRLSGGSSAAGSQGRCHVPDQRG